MRYEESKVQTKVVDINSDKLLKKAETMEGIASAIQFFEVMKRLSIDNLNKFPLTMSEYGYKRIDIYNRCINRLYQRYEKCLSS